MKPRSDLKPKLSGPLSLLLPTDRETLLLRVCVAERERARAAWHQWHDPANGSGKCLLKDPAVRKLRPLLFNAVQSHDLEIDKEGLTLLRTAYLKEDLRSSAFRRICREVLLLLEKEGFEPTILKGAALAETVYPSPVLRHCHDIDLLLPNQDLGRAARLLEFIGFRSLPATNAAPGTSVKMVHESELPLELHASLFEVPYYQSAISEIRARSQTRDIADVPARILSPVDTLIHVCGHASYSSKRVSLRWVSDAWFIVDRHPDLDWDLVLDCIRQSRLVLPMSIMLQYLAGLGASIPATFLHHLWEAASKSAPIERQLALRGTRSTGQGSLAQLFEKATTWRDRAFLLRWLIIPSPGYVVWVDQIPRWALPFHYVYRPLRFLAWEASAFFRGLIQRAA
jgi:hypothetical protein